MHKNFIWILFLSFLGILSIWFGGRAGMELYDYFSMSERVSANLEKLEIVEGKKGDYLLVADYYYRVKDVAYHQREFLKAKYPNRFAATKARNKYANYEWKAWFSAKAPEKALLEKKIPYKSILSAIVLLVLWTYFFCLGFYVGRKSAIRGN